MHRGIMTCCTLSVVNKLNLGVHVQSFALSFNNIMLLLFMTWPGGSKVAAGGGPRTTFRKRRGLELFTMLHPCINPPPRTEENVLDEKVSSCS